MSRNKTEDYAQGRSARAAYLSAAVEAYGAGVTVCTMFKRGLGHYGNAVNGVLIEPGDRIAVMSNETTSWIPMLIVVKAADWEEAKHRCESDRLEWLTSNQGRFAEVVKRGHMRPTTVPPSVDTLEKPKRPPGKAKRVPA